MKEDASPEVNYSGDYRHESSPYRGNVISMQIFLWIMQPLKFLETCAQRHGDCFEAKLETSGTLCFQSS